MNSSYSGIILAGGKNTRLGGINKAFLNIGGVLLLDRIYHVMKLNFDEIILVTNNPSDYLNWDIMIGSDCYNVRSSLTGIHAGLLYASNPYAFIVACDTPFLQDNLIKLFLKIHKPDIDILIPETSNGMEPLLSIYSKKCLKPIQNNINKGIYKISSFFNYMRMEKVSESQIKIEDPQNLSFFNINTPEDHMEALKIIQNKKNNFYFSKEKL